MGAAMVTKPHGSWGHTMLYNGYKSPWVMGLYNNAWAPWVIVSAFIFNPFFNHFYHPTRPAVPTLSLCLHMLPYMISTISTFFLRCKHPHSFPSLSSQPFTRYQAQGLLVLRAISTISTIPTISLPPPKLLHNLSRCSLQPCEHLTSHLEIVNPLLQHLNSKSYWWLHHWDYPPWSPKGSQCQIPCVGRKVF